MSWDDTRQTMYDAWLRKENKDVAYFLVRDNQNQEYIKKDPTKYSEAVLHMDWVEVKKVLKDEK